MIDMQVAGIAAVPSYSHMVLEMALEGRGALCAVDIWPPAIKCLGLIQLGQVSLSHVCKTRRIAFWCVVHTNSWLSVAV